MSFNNVNVNVSGPVQPTSTYKTKILKGNHSFASQVTEPNIKYVIKHDFVLDGDVTIPADCVLEFDGGSISGAYTITGNNTGIQAELVKILNTDVIFSGSWITSVIYPEWFGAVGNGITIDDTPFSKMADFINNNVNGHTTIKFGHNHYKFNSGIQIKKDIIIDGGGVTLEYTVDTASEIYYGLTLSKDNPIVLLNAGTVAATKDTKVITTTNSVLLEEGDYFVIEDTTDFSWDSSRNYYHAGDILKVESISGNTIYVTENITQNYSGANIVLRKLNTIKAVVSDINFICHNKDEITSDGIYIECGVDSVLQNLRGEGSFYSHFTLQFCYGASINSCFVDTETPFNSLNYGVVICSSKNVVVSNCCLKTTRHGLSIGGGGDVVTPNRYITITNCIFDTYDIVSSLDTHEIGEHLLIDNCIIKGGASICSLSTLVQNCEIFTNDAVKGYGLLAQGKGRNIIIKNNIFRYSNNDYTGKLANQILLQNLSEENTDTIVISNNVFYGGGANASSYNGCIMIRDSNKFYNIHIKSNKFYNTPDITNQPGIMFSNFSANEIVVEENYSDVPIFMNTNNLKNNINIKLIKNTLLGSSRAINCYAFKNVDVIDNYIENVTTSPISIMNPNTEEGVGDKCVIISGNTMKNCVTITSSSSVYDTHFRIECLKKAKIVNNLIVDSRAINVPIYKYRFDVVDNIVYQNNKFWIERTLYSIKNIGGTPSSVVLGDIIDNAGNTRPTNVEIGYQFFDTTLGKPIYWNGSIWVKADGTDADA